MSECAVHITEVDEDCDVCQREVTALTNNLNAAAAANTRRMKELQSLGAVVDPTFFIDMKLTLLLDVLYMRQVKSRITFESKFQEHLTAMLEDMLSQARKQRLVASPNGLRITPA